MSAPKCELCGCGELSPCPEGCAWSPEYLFQGRDVCTSCAEGLGESITYTPASSIILPGDLEYTETLTAMREGLL